MSITGHNSKPLYREEQYSPSQEYTKCHLIRAINLSVGSIVIAEPPHPPKEKYSLAEPQHPPKVKYFLNTNTTELQGGRSMAIHIPPDMIPRMDWNAEDKQAAWAFYRERLEQYFVIAGTPREAKVTHILFYGGKEASE